MLTLSAAGKLRVDHALRCHHKFSVLAEDVKNFTLIGLMIGAIKLNDQFGEDAAIFLVKFSRSIK